MKYKVFISEAAVIVHISERNLKKAKKMAIAKAQISTGSLIMIGSKINPEYLGRGNWRVPFQEIVFGFVEAQSPEEAIEKICQRLGVFEDAENFEAVPVN